MHNQWSDGEPLPEWAIDWYKSRGYNFVCPSDHNCFQSDELHFVSFKSKPTVTPEIKKRFKGKRPYGSRCNAKRFPPTS